MISNLPSNFFSFGGSSFESDNTLLSLVASSNGITTPLGIVFNYRSVIYSVLFNLFYFLFLLSFQKEKLEFSPRRVLTKFLIKNETSDKRIIAL